MKVRVLPAAKRPLVDWQAFRQVEFVLFNVGMLVGFLGLYSLFFFVQSYAISKGIMDRAVGQSGFRMTTFIFELFARLLIILRNSIEELCVINRN